MPPSGFLTPPLPCPHHSRSGSAFLRCLPTARPSSEAKPHPPTTCTHPDTLTPALIPSSPSPVTPKGSPCPSPGQSLPPARLMLCPHLPGNLTFQITLPLTYTFSTQLLGPSHWHLKVPFSQGGIVHAMVPITPRLMTYRGLSPAQTSPPNSFLQMPLPS